MQVGHTAVVTGRLVRSILRFFAPHGRHAALTPPSWISHPSVQGRGVGPRLQILQNLGIQMPHRGISHYPLHDFYEIFRVCGQFPGRLTLARLTQGVQKSGGFWGALYPNFQPLCSACSKMVREIRKSLQKVQKLYGLLLCWVWKARISWSSCCFCFYTRHTFEWCSLC